MTKYESWNFVWNISRTLMLIDIKMKKICVRIRSQWQFENLRRPLKNLRRSWHLSPFLQNGSVYLAEILYGVYVGPWCWLILKENLWQNYVTVTVYKFTSALAKFTPTLAFRSIQMTYSLKPLHPWFSNFTYSMTRLQGFWMIKFRLVGNKEWPLLLKIAKPLKS